jgi:hypothetical protein
MQLMPKKIERSVREADGTGNENDTHHIMLLTVQGASLVLKFLHGLDTSAYDAYS